MGRPFKFLLVQAVMIETNWECVQGIENVVKHKFNNWNVHVLNSIVVAV